MILKDKNIDKVFYISLFLGFLIRYILFNLISIEHIFFITPVNNYKAIQEAISLINQNVSSIYISNITHQPPILVYLLYIQGYHNLLYNILDFFIAILLYNISNKNIYIYLCYYFNPFIIISCISKNTDIFIFISLLLFIINIKTFKSIHVKRYTFWLCFCCYLDITYLPLQFLCLFIYKQHYKSVISYSILWFTIFIYLSYLLTNENWNFLSSCYLYIIQFINLRPNIGLWWYLFNEMFQRFQYFFLIFFHGHVYLYLSLLYPRYARQVPNFTIYIYLYILHIFKAYSNIQLLIFSIILVCLQYQLFIKHITYVKSIIFMSCLSLSLGSVFWYLWIYPQSGNANFVFNQTIIFNFVQCFFVIQILKAVRITFKDLSSSITYKKQL